MNIFIDLDSLNFISGINDFGRINSLELKRGDFARFNVRFVQNGAAARLDAATVLTFAAKENLKFDADPVVFNNDFTQSADPSPDPDTDPHWTGTPSFNTAELNDLFFIDADSDNDPPFVDLMAEFTWQAPSDPGATTSRTIALRVLNDVHRGDELVPTPLPSPLDWILETLGVNSYATLAAANAGEAEIGVPYFDTGENKLKSTTDVA